MTVSVDSDQFQSSTWKENASLAELILLIILGGVVMAAGWGSLIIEDPIYYAGGLVLLVLTIALFLVKLINDFMKLINSLMDFRDRLKNRGKQSTSDYYYPKISSS